MNPYTYKCLLQAYLRSHDSNKAFAVYNEMRRRGYKLDIFAYNMLLDALAKDEKVCILTFSLFYATLMFNIEMLKRQLVC
jgi:pentatricopeptide repeat protein